MHRPRGSIFKPALEGKRAFTRIVGQIQKQPGGRVRQDQRLSYFESPPDQRFSPEQVHSCFEPHFDEARGWKHDEILDAVVLQESHVSAIKSSDPRRGGPRQPDIEQSATTRCQTTFPHVAGLMPPPALVPRVSWQIKMPPRRRECCEVEHYTCEMQIHRRFQQ